MGVIDNGAKVAEMGVDAGVQRAANIKSRRMFNLKKAFKKGVSVAKKVGKKVVQKAAANPALQKMAATAAKQVVGKAAEMAGSKFPVLKPFIASGKKAADKAIENGVKQVANRIAGSNAAPKAQATVTKAPVTKTAAPKKATVAKAPVTKKPTKAKK